MTKHASALLAEAMALPEEELPGASACADASANCFVREHASVGDDPSVLEAWLDVAEQRALEVDRGEVQPVPWSEARRRIFSTD